jgi:hypothetical protein
LNGLPRKTNAATTTEASANFVETANFAVLKKLSSSSDSNRFESDELDNFFHRCQRSLCSPTLYADPDDDDMRGAPADEDDEK